ncbi:hypothetical protein HY633_04715 [Candidatus Uhrbacteria bacterium]|nr:hypothetical protein [Candidatus Uhrbacteria bacterium]
MKPDDVLKKLESCGAVLRNTHVALQGRRHGDAYVDFKKVFLDVMLASEFGEALAMACADFMPDAVVGPPMGADRLAYEVGLNLAVYQNRLVMSPYAEKIGGPEKFEFRPEFLAAFAGKKFLIVEDVKKTGDSADALAAIVTRHGGIICGKAAVVDRRPSVGGFRSLLQLELPDWPEDECKLCGVIELNRTVGQWKDYDARHPRQGGQP